MSKQDKAIFVCRNCGNETPVWSGKCSFCNAWNSLTEFKPTAKTGVNIKGVYQKPKVLKEINPISDIRIKSGILEFDRVLGGGMVKGSLILFAGEPGIGKSTLLGQLANKISGTLYISAEESLNQIKDRFDRLKVSQSDLAIIAESNLENILEIIDREKPKLLIIDSIQTISSAEVTGSAGSLTQVKECALAIQRLIKELEITTIIVGHVTKGGEVAGPRTLEHLVDVVLYLEGEKYHEGRILRGTKNRFGATDEVGIFKITSEGLVEVKNPSELFLAEMEESASGNAVAVTLEGTRPILVEVQALVLATNFGYPKRTASGYDLNRLNIIIALLSRRTGLNLNNYDVYLNLTGGLRITEPALDLPIAMAIISSYKKNPLPQKSCFFGELGLVGEIRHVLKSDQRKKEAIALGYNPYTAKNINELIKKVF